LGQLNLRGKNVSKEERIEQLAKEIEQFDYQRLKLQEQMQQTQVELQQKLAGVNQGIFTRQGEIIGLKRLIAEEGKKKKRKKKNGSSSS
jgi:TolA-binding protein